MDEFRRAISKHNMGIKHIKKTYNIKKETAKKVIAEANRAKIWKNSKYQVSEFDDGDVIHLSIKRIDIEAIHDWRELQEIKNKIVGEENEAIEIYPAESRLVDMANQYHLYVFKDPNYRIPLGFNDGRNVLNPEHIRDSGGKQRPFETPTKDCIAYKVEPKEKDGSH